MSAENTIPTSEQNFIEPEQNSEQVNSAIELGWITVNTSTSQNVEGLRLEKSLTESGQNRR